MISVERKRLLHNFILVLLGTIALPGVLAANDNPCAQVRCSGHGQCVVKHQEPACACDAGYVADHTGVNCVPAKVSAPPVPPPQPVVIPQPEPSVPRPAGSTSVPQPVVPPQSSPPPAPAPKAAPTVQSPPEPAPPQDPPSAAAAPLPDGLTLKDPGDYTPQELAALNAQAELAGAPVTAANIGLITGFIFDIGGFGLFLAGGGVVSLNLGVGLLLQYIGGGLLTIGSLIGTASMTVRHSAFRSAGYYPRTGRKAGAWVLTVLTVGLYGGAFGVGLGVGGLGGAIASLSMNGGAAILEIINFYVRKKWDTQLIKSVFQEQQAVTVVPMVSVAHNPQSNERTPLFGFAGAF